MTLSNVDALAIRRALLDYEPGWGEPDRYGPDGWAFVHRDRARSCIVSCAPHDGEEWLHASITGREGVPDYETLKMLHRAVWGHDGWAYQVFAPSAEHVNIHDCALHLWGRLDGKPALPDFTRGTGSI